MSSSYYPERTAAESPSRSIGPIHLRPLLATVLALLVAFGSVGYGLYRRDIATARRSALAGGRIVETACGPIEYATRGSGSPVLSIHGTGGGWDQGLFIARGLADRGYEVIAPSRFGYLRTPMPAHPSPQAEADQFVCLLDSLKVGRVSVIAASAGATPALQFALRHPDRVSSLVLLVPAIGGISGPDSVARVPKLIMDVILGSDFPFWAAMKVWPSISYRIVAVPASLVPTLAPSDKAQLDYAVATILPVSGRRRGIQYDAHNQMNVRPYALHAITAPTLVVSAEDDLYRTLLNARVAVGAIPGARLISFTTGGHLLLGHDAEIWPTISDFLRQSAAREVLVHADGG